MCSSSTDKTLFDISPFKRTNKGDLAIALGLAIIALITRIPFASRMIFEGDSARFALALGEYDVAQMRPHAPGYVLYVALAKLVDLFVHDPRLSLVSLSIGSSALTVFFLYYLANSMYDRSTGVISTLLLLTSPIFWFNGEIPLTYALEGCLSVIFALICYKIIMGEKKWLVLSAIVLGIATGVRQNTILFFLPLWLFAIGRSSLKEILISFSFLGIVCLSWFIPMVALTGGLERYLLAVDAQFKTWVLHPAPFLFEIIGRWKVFSTFVIYGLGLGLIPLIYYLGQFFKIPAIVEDIRLKFILFWFVPAVFFFIGVNVFNPGHILVILPPLCLCVAESIKGMAKDLAEGIKRLSGAPHAGFGRFKKNMLSYKALLVYSLVPILMINLYLFLFSTTKVSYATIQNGDRNLAERIRLTKKNFIPEKTIILTFHYNTQAGLYLPDYLIYCPFPLMFSSSEVPIEAQNVYVSFRHQTSPKTYWIPTDFKVKPISIPEPIDTVILWEKEIAKYYGASSRPLQEIRANPSDAKIYFFRVRPGEKIYYDYHYLSIE